MKKMVTLMINQLQNITFSSIWHHCRHDKARIQSADAAVFKTENIQLG